MPQANSWLLLDLRVSEQEIFAVYLSVLRKCIFWGGENIEH